MAACQRPTERVFDFSTGAPSRAGLLEVENSVLVGNEAGTLLRLGRNGQLLWRVALGREVAVPPALAGDGVIAGTVGGELVHLSLARGTERWRLTGEPPVLTPLVSDTTSVYIVGPDGAVRAHAVDTGHLRWRRPAPKVEESRLEASSRLPAPVLAGGLLVVALGDAGLVALSTVDGAPRWRQQRAQVLGMTHEGGALYVTMRGGQVLALGLADGTLRWEQALAPALTSPPTLAQGLLWLGAEPSQLLALSPTDGKVVSSTPLPAPLVTWLAIHGELLLVPTRGQEGRLLALRRQGGTPAFSLRTDTPLRTRPVVLGDQLFVLGLDGRVLSWRIRTPEP